MITRKVLIGHIAFWLLTLVDYTFIANWLAQNNQQVYQYNNPLGVHYLLYEIIKNIPHLFLHVTFCYVNLLVIIPYFFKRKKYIIYILVLLLITACLYLPLRFFIEDRFYKLIGGTGLTYTNKVFWITDSSVYIFRIYFYGIAYYLTWKWAQGEKEREELKAQNLKTELSFLKTQINPHFLFNTLSNLHSLAYRKSDKTADALIKLSEIMRYMLHDSNQAKIVLSEELRYLTNFIELEKLRNSKPSYLSFSVHESMSEELIAPLLLIPFVENVFKHGDINDATNPVYINLSKQESELVFTVKNKIKHQQKDRHSGIGLQNIKRRLALIYPQQHKLSVKTDEVYHEVTLKIDMR